MCLLGINDTFLNMYSNYYMLINFKKRSSEKLPSSRILKNTFSFNNLEVIHE